jgi:hypothetical protein
MANTKKKPKKTETTTEPLSAANISAARYRRAETELETFLKDPNIREVMQELYQLVEERNATLDEAIRNIKSELQRTDQAQLVFEGLGAQKRHKRWYDTDFLAEHLPHNQAQLVLTSHLEWELNQTLLEQLLRQGELDSTVVKQAYHDEPDSPAVLPGTPKPFTLPPLPID